MSQLGEILQGVGEAGSGFEGAKLAGKERAYAVQQQRQQDELQAEELRNRALDRWLKSNAERYTNVWTDPATGNTYAYDRFTNSQVLVPYGKGTPPITPVPQKPVKQELSPAEKEQEEIQGKIKGLEGALGRPLTPKEKQVYFHLVEKPEREREPAAGQLVTQVDPATGQTRSMVWDPHRNKLTPAPPGIFSKDMGPSEIFDAMEVSPKKFAYGRAHKIIPPLNNKLMGEARDIERGRDSLLAIKAEFDKLQGSIPPAEQNSPFDEIARRIKRGIYSAGISPGALGTLISMTERNKYAGLKAVAPQIRQHDLVEKIVQHMPVATDTPAQFASKWDAIFAEVDNALERTLQDSGVQPEEWDLMKGQSFKEPPVPGRGPAAPKKADNEKKSLVWNKSHTGMVYAGDPDAEK